MRPAGESRRRRRDPAHLHGAEIPTPHPSAHDHGPVLRRAQGLLGVAGVLYFVWWRWVAFQTPDAFDPPAGRLAVIAWFLACFAATKASRWAARHAVELLSAGTWLLTAHYFWLFHRNGGDALWAMGSFVTVIGVAMIQLTPRAVVAYGAFAVAAAGAVSALHPEGPAYFPGVLTTVGLTCSGILFFQRTETRLAEAHDHLAALFDSTFEGVILHDKGVIVTVNRAIAEMLRARVEDLPGRGILDFVHPDDRAAVAPRIGSATAVPIEGRAMRTDGTTFPIEVRGRDFRSGGRTLRLVTVRDTSDRQAAAEARVRAEATQRALEIRDQFIGVASHELRTPLTAMRLVVEATRRKIARAAPDPVAPEAVEQLLVIVERQVDRLVALVEDMLDVSRIAAGRLRLRVERVDLAELARQAAMEVDGERAAAGIELTVRADRPVEIDGDPGRLDQVVVNLLTNACKYAPGSAVELLVDRLPTGDARLRVDDRGPGVDPALLETIFGRFERAVDARHQSGLGLGLYIAREIVERHGGRVYAENRPDGGARFTVILPPRPESTDVGERPGPAT